MIDPGIVTLAVVAVIGVVMGLAFALPNRRAPIEKDLTPAYQERCIVVFEGALGFRAGGNLPVWRVSLYDEFLVVSFLRQVVVRYDEIASIDMGGINRRAVRLKLHHNADAALLYVTDPARVIELINNKKDGKERERD